MLTYVFLHFDASSYVTDKTFCDEFKREVTRTRKNYFLVYEYTSRGSSPVWPQTGERD